MGKTPFIKACMSTCQSKCEQKCASAELDTTGDEISSKQNTTLAMNESAKDNATAAAAGGNSTEEKEMAKSFGSDTPKAKAVKDAADKTSETAAKESSSATKADGE